MECHRVCLWVKHIGQNGKMLLFLLFCMFEIFNNEKLGGSVTFIPIRTLSYIFGHELFLYHFKDFSPCVFSKEAWVPGVLWGK